MPTRTTFRTSHIATAVVAIAALAASASSFAGGGEALDIELPSMRTPVATGAAVASSPESNSLAATHPAIIAAHGGPLTREQVREQLREARASGTLSMHGEAGDTPNVLAAREAFNTAQGEAITAAYVAEQERMVALAEAELRRSQAITEDPLAHALALSEGEALLPEGAAAVDGDETEVRIDVIDMQTSATSPASELVIVSLDGGDAAAQHAHAMHVRRQLGAMGLPQDRIYVEGSGADGEGAAVAAAEGDMDVAVINGTDAAVAASAHAADPELAAVEADGN